MYNRDLLWRSVHGELKKVRDLEDDHVVNILNYLPTSHHTGSTNYDKLFNLFKKEVELRGLIDKVIRGKQIPYRDSDGNLWTWDCDKNKPILLEDASDPDS